MHIHQLQPKRGSIIKNSIQGHSICELQNAGAKTKIKKTFFKNSQLQEADFTDCDLANSSFENCNLAKARFENTILEKVDFRTSCNYSINPEINRIKKAKFSLTQVAGLLDKYDIEIDGAN